MFIPSHHVLPTLIRPLLNSPSTLSPSSYDITFMTMHCTHYVISTILWCWEAQHQAQDFWCPLTTADTRGRIDRNTADDRPPNATLGCYCPSFYEGALLPDVQPGWTSVSLHGCPSSCFQSVKIQCAWVQWDYFFPGVGFGISLCWNLRGFCQPISPACQSASDWQQTHLLHQALLPDFCVLPLLRHHFVPLARSLMKMLNSSGLSQALWLITTAFRGTLCCWSHSCEPSSWATFQSISL